MMDAAIALAPLLAAGLGLLWLGLVGYVAWGLTHPPRRTYGSAVAKGLAGDPSELDRARAFVSWRVSLGGGREMEAWSVEGDAPEGPVVVLAHGWADGRIGGLVRVPWLAGWASRVVLFDLPGHGETPGACRLGTREVEDVRAVVAALRAEDEGRVIVVYGWSMGAGVAIGVAAAEGGRIAGVVAEAPYRWAWTPARNVLRASGLPWRTNLGPALALLGVWFGVGWRWRGFDREALAGKLGGASLLVVHGSEDEICPVAEGEAIARAAGAEGRLEVIDGGGHNDLWTDDGLRARVSEAVEDWARGLEWRRA